ncbi:MAG TPA: hypothetical protein DCM40_29130 [Maribacter sp.]|nr:hypothetical protein [Maribacter sp.]
MSFVKIDNNNFEYTGLNLRPNVTFISSSVGGGVTGSNFVSPVRSKTLKNFASSFYDLNGDRIIDFNEGQNTPETRYQRFLVDGNCTSTNIKSTAEFYLNSVGAASQVAKNTKTIDMFRFDLPVFFNSNRTVKNIVRKVLMPHHQHRYDNCAFTYSNYHTLNFFTSTTIPTGSALIYPNSSVNGNGVYNLPDSFSVNFWINPRYTDANYKAGTILHLSSSIAVSLVSGSSRDENNEPNNFRILLQLSQSADTPPSTIGLASPSTTYPNDLIFTSSHTLSKNHWHHVCIQWSNSVNNSVGSIFVDDQETNFTVPSSSVSANINLDPSGLVLGNYFDSDAVTLGNLLNNTLSTEQGFTNTNNPQTTINVDETTFSHPLNAEIHEVKIYDKVLANPETLFETERQKARNSGPSNYDNLIFYVPPFFYPTTPSREVHITPFQTITSTTDDPFNVAFSFGINGKLINLENFTREFVRGINPRLYGLFPVTFDKTIENITADQFIYDTGSHKKRNMTILPNDNGLFKPNFFALSSSPMSSSAKFYAKQSQVSGLPDYSIISLENLIPSGVIYKNLAATSGSMYNSLVASTSIESPGIGKSVDLDIAQRTGDRSSNEIVIYDISNIYYGNRIHPGSFELFEKDLTGSDGKIKIKLKDNERGSLYRADALTEHAKWNNVGTILYDEGMAVVKSPHLFFFNKNETNVTFRGEQNLHTMILNVPAFKELFTSSSNPTFVSIPPSTGANNEDLSTLYITTVNIHDDNFNIIMKANFAQPIFKTEEDEFIIRLKEDF